jgi:hypothetical protein
LVNIKPWASVDPNLFPPHADMVQTGLDRISDEQRRRRDIVMTAQRIVYKYEEIKILRASMERIKDNAIRNRLAIKIKNMLTEIDKLGNIGEP